MTAAAGGAYVAIRQNESGGGASASGASGRPDSTASPALKDTEAIVTPPAPTPAAGTGSEQPGAGGGGSPTRPHRSR